MNSKIPPWHEEMQDAIKEIALFYCLSSKDLVPFLTTTLCGQFVIAGYSEEFIKRTLDHMFESYLRIKNKMENKK